MKAQVSTLLALGALVALVSACSGGNNAQATASPTETPTASPPAASAEPTTAETAATVATATAEATATATAATDPLASVQFSDISGNVAETAIRQEAALGVFGTKTGTFNPDGHVTRAQYVAWLVTANNIYFKDTPQSQIRLANSSTDQSFVDVPKSDPNFPQIEGMADAGYVIGVDKAHFAPKRELTREELVAIQVARYMNGAAIASIPAASGMYCVRLNDAAQISKPYWGAFNTDQCTGFSGQDDLHRIFGSVRTLHPQRPVTRAEVAIALQKIAGRSASTQLK